MGKSDDADRRLENLLRDFHDPKEIARSRERELARQKKEQEERQRELERKKENEARESAAAAARWEQKQRETQELLRHNPELTDRITRERGYASNGEKDKAAFWGKTIITTVLVAGGVTVWYLNGSGPATPSSVSNHGASTEQQNIEPPKVKVRKLTPEEIRAAQKNADQKYQVPAGKPVETPQTSPDTYKQAPSEGKPDAAQKKKDDFNEAYNPPKAVWKWLKGVFSSADSPPAQPASATHGTAQKKAAQSGRKPTTNESPTKMPVVENPVAYQTQQAARGQPVEQPNAAPSRETYVPPPQPALSYAEIRGQFQERMRTKYGYNPNPKLSTNGFDVDYREINVNPSNAFGPFRSEMYILDDTVMVKMAESQVGIPVLGGGVPMQGRISPSRIGRPASMEFETPNTSSSPFYGRKNDEYARAYVQLRVNLLPNVSGRPFEENRARWFQNFQNSQNARRPR